MKNDPVLPGKVPGTVNLTTIDGVLDIGPTLEEVEATAEQALADAEARERAAG